MSEPEQRTEGLPRVVTEGKTPGQWVEFFAERGIAISERTLRERARALGAFWAVGKAMVLLPEHIDQLFEPPKPRRASVPHRPAPPQGDYAKLVKMRAKQEAERNASKKGNR